MHHPYTYQRNNKTHFTSKMKMIKLCGKLQVTKEIFLKATNKII